MFIYLALQCIDDENLMRAEQILQISLEVFQMSVTKKLSEGIIVYICKLF